VTRVVHGGAVEVEFDARARCRGCDGACVWLRLPVAQRMSFDCSEPLAVGENVIVTLPDRYLLLASLVAHGLPLAALLAGAMAGFASTGGDAGAVLGALAGIAVALIAAPKLRTKLERSLLRRVELRAAGAHAHSL
jgi:positive regulator of sigma E activity